MAMLKAIGIRAFPVLVNTHRGVVQDGGTPGLVFDHVDSSNRAAVGIRAGAVYQEDLITNVKFSEPEAEAPLVPDASADVESVNKINAENTFALIGGSCRFRK